MDPITANANDAPPQNDSAPATDGTAQQQPSTPDAGATDQQQALGGRKPQWGAADTQAAQQLSKIKAELGLPKNASEAKVIEAIQAARQPVSTDYDSLDPVIREQIEARDTELWEMSREVYGDAVIDAATELFEAARSMTPRQFAKMYVDSVLAVTEAPGDDSGDDAQQGDQQQSNGAEPMPTLGDGDGPLVPRDANNDPTFGLRDTGDMRGFVRGIFGR